MENDQITYKSQISNKLQLILHRSQIQNKILFLINLTMFQFSSNLNFYTIKEMTIKLLLFWKYIILNSTIFRIHKFHNM